MKSLLGILLLLVILPNDLSAQSLCIGGKVDGIYDCNKVDLMAIVTPEELLAEDVGGVFLNDIWGWTDPETAKEYALVGMTNGTSFVDISDPVNPLVIGILPEHEQATASGRIAHDGAAHDSIGGAAKSLWRDIKTYKNHAFIVSEDSAAGMQVFDLTQLRGVDKPPVTFGESAHYDQIGNAHNIVINEQSGFAYAVGATKSSVCSQGGLHIIDISDPVSPTYAGCFDNDGYTHDAQCVIYDGPDEDYKGREICFNSNENTVAIVDVTDKSAINLIANKSHNDAAYTHQGWLSEDHQFFFSNDELDELSGNVDSTATYVWDMSDLDQPVLIRRYDHPRYTVDHNLYVSGDRIYQSNYTTGLVILDEALVTSGDMEPELAFFDSYHTNNQLQFRGSWSNYPFFSSGVVAMTDMTGGLFLVRPNFELTVLSQSEDVSVCQGASVELNVEVAQSDVSFQWQVFTDGSYVDIQDGEQFQQSMTSTLLVEDVQSSALGLTVRCKMTTAAGGEYYGDDINVTLIDPPVAAFSVEIDGTQVTLINESTGADSFLWDLGIADELDSINPITIFTYPLESATYQVSLLASNACGTDTLTKEVVLEVLSLPEQHLSIYPNPVNQGVLNIDIKDGKQFKKMQLLDSSGRVIQSSSSLYMNVSAVSSGIYLLRVETSEGPSTARVVIFNQ